MNKILFCALFAFVTAKDAPGLALILAFSALFFLYTWAAEERPENKA